ncbi:MAG: NTP transferase domain-containing protein [Syntrophomonadaceae bacterium]|jgi:mannose-1-phosphate guanylyltransferase/mannose-6-phosphate isomerase|nr:NTP transferase domain-containing protein [Syntrophomonadaceae bacterium]
MIAVILAGGRGLRLWPESRHLRPKQLCKLVNNKSMLDNTIDRLTAAGPSKIIIITSDDLLSGVEAVIEDRTDAYMIEVLTEPEGKNTAPAVGLVLARLQQENSDEILGFFPADHHISDAKAFADSMERAIRAAQQGHIATIGIAPDRPETGYGYIEKTKWELGEIGKVFQVSSFREKPDLPTAETYINSGQYVWNAGIYIGSTAVLLDEFHTHLPDIYEKISKGFEAYLSSYAELPSISLDYGIAEKSKRMAVVPADFGWCDLGSWNALADIHEQDELSNVCTGSDIVVLDSHNCVVKQREKTIVLYGVEDTLVVETDDIILVSNRHLSQDIRKITEILKEKERLDLL